MLIKRTLIAATALLLPAATFAQPIVTENVISWPDDGWYQVQSAISFESLCEGGSSCTVGDGSYIVINHTTGLRSYINVAASQQDTQTLEPTSSVVYDLPADFGTSPGATNISIAAYSDQIAELTWDVIKTETGRVITEKVEIWRDGVQIDTLSGRGVTSYLDWDRTLGQPYTYHIVAISSEGRNTVKFVDANGGIANPYRPFVTTDALPTNLEQNLTETFELINGTVAQNIGAVIHRLFESTPSELGLSLFEETGNYKLYNCPAGGTLFLYEEPSFRQLFPSSCAIGSLVIDGGQAFQRIYTEYDTIAPSRIHQDIDPELVGTSKPGFSIEGGEVTLSDNRKSRKFIPGVFTISDSRDNSLISSTFFSAAYDDNVQLNLNSFSHAGLIVDGKEIGDIIVDGNATEPLNGEIRTGFRVTINNSNGTFGERVRARTQRLFTLDEEYAQPSNGSLAFYSLDIGNETYGIDADNGNPQTFTLNATRNGVLTSYDVSWSDAYTFALPSLNAVDVGF